MKKFFEPELTVLYFEVEDIITTSGDEGFGEDGEDMGGWG